MSHPLLFSTQLDPSHFPSTCFTDFQACSFLVPSWKPAIVFGGPFCSVEKITPDISDVFASRFLPLFPPPYLFPSTLKYFPTAPDQPMPSLMSYPILLDLCRISIENAQGCAYFCIQNPLVVPVLVICCGIINHHTTQSVQSTHTSCLVVSVGHRSKCSLAAWGFSQSLWVGQVSGCSSRTGCRALLPQLPSVVIDSLRPFLRLCATGVYALCCVSYATHHKAGGQENQSHTSCGLFAQATPMATLRVSKST